MMSLRSVTIKPARKRQRPGSFNSIPTVSGSIPDELFKAQSGDLKLVSLISQFLTDMGKYAHIPIPDPLVAEIEGLAALVIAIQGCTDYVSMSAVVLLYVRKFFDKSITGQVVNYIQEIFDFDAQAGLEDLKSSDNWIDLVRNIRENWSLCKGNKLFGHFSKLLGLLVVLGLCKSTDVTFSVKEYKLFEPDLKVIHGNAMDIADAAFGTVTFFVESMILCFQQKSLMPLLISDKAAAELDEEYANIILWWDLVKNGNLMRVAGICDSEFDKRLEALCTKLRVLVGSRTSFEKKFVQDKFMRLLKVKNDYVTMKISSGVRRAPFAMELFGESSQGKTTCGDQLVDALLTSQKQPIGKEYRASYNASDKYMSNWTTDKLVMTIDDMANEKSEFVERPPTRVIIDVCNNQPFYANMADLDSKGKVFVEPAIVVVNTNVKDLDARVYSNCPYSVQRRMDVIITVEAKPEFQHVIDGKTQGIDSAAIAEFQALNGNESTFDDIWNLTVEKAVKPSKLNLTAGYAPVTFRGKQLVNVPFRTVLQFCIEMNQRHNLAQDNILARMKKRATNIFLCPSPGCKQIHGYCDLHDHLEFEEKFEEHFGDEIVSAIEKAGSMVSNRIRTDIFGFGSALEGASSIVLLSSAKMFSKHWDWMTLVPTPWLRNNMVKKVLMYGNEDQLHRSYVQSTAIMWGTALTIFGLGTRRTRTPNQAMVLGWGLFSFCFMRQKCMVEVVKANFEQELIDRNTIAPIVAKWRDEHVGKVCHAASIVGALYALSKIYKSWRKLREQGSLEPANAEDIAARDATHNAWSGVSVRPLPVQTNTCTASQLSNIVSKNLVYGTVVTGDRKLMVNGLFIRSNVVVIPSHYFETDNLDVTFRKSNPDDCGGKFVVRLSLASSVRIPQTDLCVCYASSGGSFKDLTRYFPTENCPEHEFQMLYRTIDGVLHTHGGLATPKITTNSVCHFLGGEYATLSINTFKGLCGAVLIAQGKYNTITGFHLGGKEGTPRGCYGSLTAPQISDALGNLRTMEGVLLTGTAENFEKQVLGINILKDTKLHPKSPLNYMPPDAQIEYYGSCPGMSSSKSDVRVMPISPIVLDVLGVPNKWGPPKMQPEWFGWQTCLANLALPAHPYRHELLELAVVDYKSDMLPVFKSNLWNDARPLTDHENLCGIPGKKFMDSINLNTSVGYPLGGPKRAYVIELPPTAEKPNNRVLEPVILDEIERCESCYLRGERAYPIAKACKKDEVLAKEKCRIFYGNAISLTWLVRKYYLPILRVMQMNPLVSECAVGINSHGPEWQEFHDHVMTHGDDRLIGGDYGKYDQKLPSQLIIAALRILIDFARECNYSSQDLSVMEAMAGDIVFAVIAYNGDLIGLTEGTHISGNSLTVIINGICGSLNLRCYFYTQYPTPTIQERLKFRECVKLMTYGDDNIGSVRKGIDKFTIKGASAFLAEYGQVYTMPDKTSELLDYLPAEEFEFLKRKSMHHLALGVCTGALAEDSIFKMLHCYLRPAKSPNSEDYACALNIDTALREWFNYGPDVYEVRRDQMREVANRANIAHLCLTLDETYEDKVKEWREKYVTRTYSTSTPESDFFTTQSGTEQNLYAESISMIKMRVVAIDTFIICQSLGEIDLAFQYTDTLPVGSVSYNVYVEVKHSLLPASKRKGRDQITRITHAMQVLAPHQKHLGLLYTRRGWEVVSYDGTWPDHIVIKLPLQVQSILHSC